MNAKSNWTLGAGVVAVAAFAAGCGMTKSPVPSTRGSVSGQASLASSGGWMPAPAMQAARYGAAVAVANGRIYAMGGDDGGGPLALVEIFDPALGQWIGTHPLTTPRRYGSAVTLNGTIYVLGGQDYCSGQMTGYAAGVERMDASGAFVAAPPMPIPGCHMAAAVVDGKILVGGGFTFSGGHLPYLQEFDPSTQAWTMRPLAPNRLGAGAAALGGLFVLVGGDDASSGTTGAVSTFHPVAMQWASQLAMPTARSGLAVAAYGDSIYAIGGMATTPLKTVEAFRFAPENSAGAVWTPMGPMNQARLYPGAAVLGGTLYAIGGYDGVGAVATVERLVLGALADDSK